VRLLKIGATSKGSAARPVGTLHKAAHCSHGPASRWGICFALAARIVFFFNFIIIEFSFSFL
jgi:hypothetical protein